MSDKRPGVFRRLTRRISNFFRGTLLVIGRLLGVKQIDTNKYDSSRTITASWIFILGIPIGLVILGPWFPILIWLAIVTGVLMVVNLDDALLMTATFAEYGVDKIIEEIPT